MIKIKRKLFRELMEDMDFQLYYVQNAGDFLTLNDREKKWMKKMNTLYKELKDWAHNNKIKYQ